MNKHWFHSQNHLTPDLLILFFHIKNIPFFVLLFFLNLFTDFIWAVCISLAYFAVMITFFPPTIMEKDKTIYVLIIQFVDKIFKKFSLENFYFKIMNK